MPPYVEKLSDLLAKRFPKLYSRLVRTQPLAGHRRIGKIIEIVVGPSTVAEVFWRTQHLRRPAWTKQYWSSQTLPYRRFLVDRVATVDPRPSTLLEVGCNTGPNFPLLRQRFPETRLMGIDLNEEAVSVGRDLLARTGYANIELSVGKIDEMKDIPDRSVDVVLSCSVLELIGPDKIQNTVQEIVRVARRGIVLMEFQDSSTRGLGIRHVLPRGLTVWKRDYRSLLGRMVDQEKIRITFVPKELEAPEELNSVIEVML